MIDLCLWLTSTHEIVVLFVWNKAWFKLLLRPDLFSPTERLPEERWSNSWHRQWQSRSLLTKNGEGIFFKIRSCPFTDNLSLGEYRSRRNSNLNPKHSWSVQWDRTDHIYNARNLEATTTPTDWGLFWNTAALENIWFSISDECQFFNWCKFLYRHAEIIKLLLRQQH